MCIGELRATVRKDISHATVIPSKRKFVVAVQTAVVVVAAAAAKSDNCFYSMVLSRVHHIFIKPPRPAVNCYIFITIIRVPYN